MNPDPNRVDTQSQPVPKFILLLQFFIIPFAIVLVGVGIYLGFSWMVGQSRTAQDVMQEMKLTGGARRGDLAREFLIAVTRDPQGKVTPPMVAETLALFRSVPKVKEEEMTRCSLAQALGAMHGTEAIPDLIEILDAPATEFNALRVSCMEALSYLGKNERILHASIRLIKDPDAEVRKRSVYTLGMQEDPLAIEPLKKALNDSRDDVAWNAAAALASHYKDPACKPVLQKMLDRTYLDDMVRRGVAEQFYVDRTMETAINAVYALNDRSFVPQLEQVGAKDPSVFVKHLAQEVLARWREQPK